jgi:hypothetical protein
LYDFAATLPNALIGSKALRHVAAALRAGACATSRVAADRGVARRAAPEPAQGNRSCEKKDRKILHDAPNKYGEKEPIPSISERASNCKTFTLANGQVVRSLTGVVGEPSTGLRSNFRPRSKT